NMRRLARNARQIRPPEQPDDSLAAGLEGDGGALAAFASLIARQLPLPQIDKIGLCVYGISGGIGGKGSL
ncbi:hypothetical protein AAER55_09705, partial [Acinetobacter baumannii]|uniref:hypothetical protein n=1 Tax=Acinetobacter baumannii TaxID=470 RepID=UPI0031F414F1